MTAATVRGPGFPKVDVLNFAHGTWFIDSIISFHCLLHYYGLYGIHDGRPRRPWPAFPFRVLHDVSRNARAEYDDVLLHRHGQAGERSVCESSPGQGIHPAYEGIQSQGVPACPLGHAVHDGNPDPGWRR